MRMKKLNNFNQKKRFENELSFNQIYSEFISQNFGSKCQAITNL